MELDKIQNMWIENLRAHPERQGKTRLGSGTPKDYKACCLGEGLIYLHRAGMTSSSSQFNIQLT